MNCCHENNDKKNCEHKGKHKGHMSHMWMMILCCGAPVLLLMLLPLLGNIFPGAAGYISKIIPFLCPVMMIAMLPMMFGKGGNTENKPTDTRQLEKNEQDKAVQ